MREVIYLSQGKLDRMFLTSQGPPGPMKRIGGGTLGVGPIKAELTIHPTPSAVDTGRVVLAAKLQAVIRHLEQTHPLVPFTTAGLSPHQWIRFDLPMGYGTVHEDSGWRPDDVALFAGVARSSDAEQSCEVRLLLCGSVQHLCDRLASAGRAGSGCDWLRELALEVSRREDDGVDITDSHPTSIVPPPLSSPEQVAFWSWRIMKDNHPPGQWGRLRGYARVLMNVDDPGWPSRLVLATPLFVEIPPAIARISWWRRLLLAMATSHGAFARPVLDGVGGR